MYWPDVIDLKHFYSTPAGELVLASLRQHIRKLWPSLKNESVLGIGFSTPILNAWLYEADTAWACMPAQQGVIHWPQGELNRTFLANEIELPFADNSISRIVLMHALENTEHVRHLVKEVWRVLRPTGRVLVIVPNRLGIWARATGSPFAEGHPYTIQQLHDLLFDNSLTPLNTERAVFFWPVQFSFMLRLARFMEGIGRFLWPRFGGLILMEAEKQIYAPSGGLRAPAVTRPIPMPAAKPVLGKISGWHPAQWIPSAVAATPSAAPRTDNKHTAAPRFARKKRGIS